jgi:hypothetical protein
VPPIRQEPQWQDTPERIVDAAIVREERKCVDDERRGDVFGFDNRRGIKGVVSKETERKDPNAFKGVDASAVRRAAQGPAGPVRGSQTGDADELRRKRMARFGGGAATATRP